MNRILEKELFPNRENNYTAYGKPMKKNNFRMSGNDFLFWLYPFSWIKYDYYSILRHILAGILVATHHLIASYLEYPIGFSHY